MRTLLVLTRGVRWPPVGVSVALAALVVTVPALAPRTWHVPGLWGVAGAACGAAAAYALDDPAAAVADAAPTSLRRRTAVRLAIVGALTAAVLGGAWLAGGPSAHDVGPLIGSTGLGAAAASVGRRHRGCPGGLTATALAAVLLGVALVEPLGRWVVLFTPGPDGWIRTWSAWATATVLSVAVVIHATREPFDR